MIPGSISERLARVPGMDVLENLPGLSDLHDFDATNDLHIDAAARYLLERFREHEDVDAFQLLFDHVVDRVAACTAHAKYRDPGLQFFLTRKREVQCHCQSACYIGPSHRADSHVIISILTTHSRRVTRKTQKNHKIWWINCEN